MKFKIFIPLLTYALSEEPALEASRNGFFYLTSNNARAIRFFPQVDFSQIWFMMYGTYVFNQKLN